MVCPKCGNILPDEALFCNNCGDALRQSAPNSKNKNHKQIKNRVKHNGRAIRSVTKIVATFAVTTGALALLWTPIIQPILMSKTTGPQDTTGYNAKLDYKKGVTNDADFPDGKWVRKDGKAVLYIAHMESANEFQFELYASEQGKEKSCELADDAVIDKEFQPNNEVKAIAYYKTSEQEQEEKLSLNFEALNNEDAIRIISEQSWIDSHMFEVLPDGTYYRVFKELIPNQAKKDKLSPSPQPKNEKEPPKDVIKVRPPSIPKNGKPPKRVSGGREYLSAELMEILYNQGFYISFEGTYIVKKADVHDHNKYFNYHFYEDDDPLKNYCTGTQEGIDMVQARYDSMQKIEDSLYGKTKWDFSSNVDFMPQFVGMWLEQSGSFTTRVTLSSQILDVGYELNEIDWYGMSKNSNFKTNWCADAPHVINVTGGIHSNPNDSDVLTDKLEYDLNLYFYTDGTVDAEGFLTMTAKGTDYITYWIEMSAVEFQVDYEYQKYFNFKSVKYLYSFETLDEDVPEYSFERETDYVATGDNYNYRKYEYEKSYQTQE